MTNTRILIVEDEGIVASDIDRQLARLGYRVVGIASTGEEAVALAGRLTPDLVLMDIRLAGPMDGIDAATTIRSRFSIPSVFLTAYATDEMVDRAKRAEPLGYLIKPFDEHSLRTTVEIALHKSRLDRRLHESESRYRATVQSAHDAVITADAQSRIAGWSPAATRLFGYDEAEMLGQPVTRLMPLAFREPHPGAFSQVTSPQSTERFQRLREVEGLRRDGTAFPMELSLASWSTPEGMFVTAFIRDISDRKRSEAILRLQSAALNAAANAIVITNRDGDIEWVNAAFIQSTGYALSEAMGKNLRELVKSGVHNAAFYDQMWATLVAGDVWVGEVTNRRRDGTLFVEDETITPVRNAEGEVTHYIGVKRDLTDQKRLQEQFLQAQKMEVVGRLAGGIAHDFNNLLTVINGRSELALEVLAADDPMREEFQEIRAAGERAARLTMQLLMFSRKQVVRPTTLNATALVTNAAQMLRRLIGEDIRLVIGLPDPTGLDNVVADRGQIEQVLFNLAVNARDAMPRGGTLTISVQSVDLDRHFVAAHPAVQAGPHVRLTVTDTGTGMSPDVCSHIFEPFFTTKSHNKGTGLGLATVHGIIAEHHGCVTVDSAPNHGATFSVYLPTAASAVHEPAAAGPGVARGTETILLAEDERALRELTAKMLRTAGYTVIPTEDGPMALAALASPGVHVDLLVTDVIMPGMSGPELAAQILKSHPSIRVLFTSGYTDDKLTLGAGLNVDQFIPKPYSIGDLTRAIRGLLDTTGTKPA